MSFKSKRIYTMSLCQFISLLLLQRPVATWLRNYPTSEVEAVCFCALPLSMRPCTLYIAIYHMHTVWPCIWRNGLAPCCAMTVGKSTSGIKYQNFFMANWQSRFLNVSLCYTEALLCQYHYVCKQRFNWIIQITHNDAITDLCLNSEFITLVGFFSFCCHSLFFLLCHAADKSAFR